MSKLTVPRRKIRRNSFVRILKRQLHTNEVDVILDVLRAGQRGNAYHAGRLGVAESLVRRGWLRRNSDGTVSLSEQTRTLLIEIGGNW